MRNPFRRRPRTAPEAQPVLVLDSIELGEPIAFGNVGLPQTEPRGGYSVMGYGTPPAVDWMAFPNVLDPAYTPDCETPEELFFPSTPLDEARWTHHL